MEVKMENCFQRLQVLCNFTVIFPSTATGMDQNQSMWAEWKHSGERIGHISFKAESAFLKIPLRSLNMLAQPQKNALWWFASSRICGIG